MKWMEKIRRFMYGRNGMDALNHALFWVYLALWFINLFFGSRLLWLLCTAAAVWLLFRCFSRNLPARRAENMKYWNLKTDIETKMQNVALFRKLGAFFKKLGSRLKHIGSRRYRTCPHCRAELCLPRRTGKHTVKCPRCGKEFGVTIVI